MTFDDDDAHLVCKETFLSRKPEKASILFGIGATMVLLIFSQIYWSNLLGIANTLSGNQEAVFHHHQYWRLITGTLVHADLSHFLSNALPFAFLSGLIFGYYGVSVYLVLVLGGASLTNLVSLATYPSDAILVGASGAVYLMAAFWLSMYLCIERRHSMAQRLLRGIGFALVMLFPTSLVPGVSYRTHAIGFAIGLAAGFFYFLRRKAYFRRFEIFEYEPD
jgi:rhomboid protease GluP